jgi:hypothetical protein
LRKKKKIGTQGSDQGGLGERSRRKNDKRQKKKKVKKRWSLFIYPKEKE